KPECRLRRPEESSGMGWNRRRVAQEVEGRTSLCPNRVIHDVAAAAKVKAYGPPWGWLDDAEALAAEIRGKLTRPRRQTRPASVPRPGPPPATFAPATPRRCRRSPRRAPIGPQRFPRALPPRPQPR